MEVAALQGLVTKYPWFSYAREVLLCRLVAIEPQCLESRYKEAQAFFPKRERVFFRCRELGKISALEQKGIPVSGLMDVEVEPLEELNLDLSFDDFQGQDTPGDGFEVVLEKDSQEPAIEMQPVKEKIIVVGGDYFSKEDFASLAETEKVADIKFGAPADNLERETATEVADIPDYDPLDFVTETLAKIYADQGYYDKAIEVYAKLILLYPEKSSYFATLVNEIKSKN